MLRPLVAARRDVVVAAGRLQFEQRGPRPLVLLDLILDGICIDVFSFEQPVPLLVQLVTGVLNLRSGSQPEETTINMNAALC